MSKFYIFVFIALFLWLGGYIYYIFNYGELANKPFYVELQGFATKTNKNHSMISKGKVTPVFIKEGIIFQHQGYDMLGIPTKDKDFPYFWIVTNAHDDSAPPDYVFSITEGDKFYLPCNYLQNLARLQKIDDLVYDFLQKRCIDEKDHAIKIDKPTRGEQM